MLAIEFHLVLYEPRKLFSNANKEIHCVHSDVSVTFLTHSVATFSAKYRQVMCLFQYKKKKSPLNRVQYVVTTVAAIITKSSNAFISITFVSKTL